MCSHGVVFYLFMFYTFGQGMKASNGSCIILVSLHQPETDFKAQEHLLLLHLYLQPTFWTEVVFISDTHPVQVQFFKMMFAFTSNRYDTNSCKVSCRSRSPECSEMSVCCLQLTAVAVNLLDHPVQSVPSVTVVQVIWKSFWMLSQTHILRTFTL